LVAGRHAPDRRARSVSRRQRSADVALPADRGRDHPHRAAANSQLTLYNLQRGGFAAFVAKKEAAARDARLSPFTTELDAIGGEEVTSIGNAWSRELFDGPFYMSPPAADVPGTTLVFVQSKDGNTGAPNPSA